MRCSKCASDNREGRRFCTTCGTALGAWCPKCGAPIHIHEKFCGECGAALSDVQPARAEDAAPVVAAATGERRHLTVLFCDLVNSTSIAAELDPEEWRDVVADYHRAAAQVIERFGGHVAQYLGDGVMAYFGWPEAHDDDAERAARAGLAMLGATANLNAQSARPKLSARIGIDSGTVVVGASAGKDADVFGDTPNIAARVQAGATPDSVVITDATHRLVSGLFVVEDRGAQALKGIDRPIKLYRVIQPSGVRGRLEAAAATRGLTPFIGREDELGLLMSRWERAREGDGQLVLIIGEAGIGKSRLIQRFHEQIAGTPHTWIEAGAGAFFQNTPFYPVTELLQQFLGGNGGKPAEEQLTQLEPRLELAGLKPADAIPLIAPLLNLPLWGKYPPLPLPPEQRRQRLLATLVEWVLGTARVQPLVVATEDLHWADASTLELIQLLVEQGATARLLVLFTARPEFRAQWPLRAHHAQITLNRLSGRALREMIAQVAAREAMSDETIATVMERTGGVPLFVEELTRAVLESGSVKLAAREIPATLHDSLMARLDRLGVAKEVIQIGAVIGSEFSYGLLHAVHPIPDEDLKGAIRSATDAELVYVRGIAPDENYQFKHVLIRDAAYEALLKTRRKELHRQVAQTINQEFPALKESHPEILARHWSEAGETEPAIAEWSRAAKAAEARNGFKEAQENYQQALALINLLAESPERDNRELQLRQSIVFMLNATRGFTAAETIDAGQRAAALAEKSGNLKQLVDSVVSRAHTAVISGDLTAAGKLLDEALKLALRQGNSTSLAHVHMLQMQTRYSRGDLAGLEKHFTAGLKFFDDPDFKRLPAVAKSALAYASYNMWKLGRADVARQRMAQMMAGVNENNLYEVAWSAFFAATLSVAMGEYAQGETLAAHALELGEKHQLPYAVMASRVVLGLALAHLGRAKEGIALIRQGVASVLEVGALSGITYCGLSLAAAQERGGAIVDALETLEQALQANPEEVIHRPEMLTLRGELRLKQGDTELAEADFHEAIEFARNMGAKMPELQATRSLARMLITHGRRDEACTRLAEIYGWFTEGFDLPDLKEAKALLDQLGANP